MTHITLLNRWQICGQGLLRHQAWMDLRRNPSFCHFILPARCQCLNLQGKSFWRSMGFIIDRIEKLSCLRALIVSDAKLVRQTVIARRSDMLVKSSDDPLGAYVNPSGFVHEVMILLVANGLALIGRPIKEYSWFPGSDMAMEVVNESRFVSIITPVSVKENLLYLPQSFATNRGEEIPWRCFLRVRNGDFFEVRFIKSRHAFVGANTILQRYRTTAYCFIVFQYMGGPEFSMEIFSCYAVEVEYPLPGRNESLLRDPLFQRTAGAHNFSLLEDIEYELLRYNCMRDEGVSLEIKFTSPEMLSSEAGLLVCSERLHHMQYWEDGSVVTLQVGHRFMPVHISRDSGGCYFRKGWGTVVREVGLLLGDICVLAILFYQFFLELNAD